MVQNFLLPLHHPSKGFPHKKMRYNRFGKECFWKRTVNKILEYKNNGKILDIGCAYGYLLKFLPNSFEKWGMDNTKDAINIAHKVAPDANLLFRSIDESISDLKLPKFDVITCLDTLEHVNNPEIAIKNIKRLIKRDGIIIISIPLIKPIFLKKWSYKFNYPVRMIKKVELEYMIRKLNLKIIEKWATAHLIHLNIFNFYFEIWFRSTNVSIPTLLNYFWLVAKK
jgi:2-polyprenyl-3-methyl-5-hydroxy-6-metoxy-1,4-benzoquinol methylase